VIKRYYEVSANIGASPDRIWALLTDAAHYPNWNPTVQKMVGRIGPGETFRMFLKANPGHSFPVKVTEFRPNERMVWSSATPLGLIKIVRTCALAPAGPRVTRFSMREEYSGPMLGMIGKSMPDLGPAFQEFAQSLKRAAERPIRPAGS